MQLSPASADVKMRKLGNMSSAPPPPLFDVGPTTSAGLPVKDVKMRKLENTPNPPPTPMFDAAPGPG
ncbi:hypothetical protein TSUD_138810 [Trifolium subterraneum]|uniref:Uncharacterized protein n=1 Tax=Trifolium subterraneum TaxID=3900 RepID=A0A2Z6PH04_TRISU|nr:hypothetical protein TSUD_138810 [Trifolium subterraneum]